MPEESGQETAMNGLARARCVDSCAILLALAVITSCDESDEGDGTDSDTDSETGSDTDSDSDGDCDDVCCDDPVCEPYCQSGGVVPSEPSGTPATSDEICASTENPVTSTAAAVVRLTAIAYAPSAVTGLIRVSDELREQVIGLPAIEFSWETPSSPWATFEITELQPVEEGFSFTATWPLVPASLPACGGGTVLIPCRVRMSMLCGVADGGLSDDAEADGGTGLAVATFVESITYLEWCYPEETGFSPEWRSSGDQCPYSCEWFLLEPCD
jgi:hypothetical protein